jgi:hypothetical protein
MPRAGNNSANRAKAHLQWADRYNRYGDTQKAAAHFGRALEYDRRSGRGQEFGVVEEGESAMHHTLVSDAPVKELVLLESIYGGASRAAVFHATVDNVPSVCKVMHAGELKYAMAAQGPGVVRVMYVCENFGAAKGVGASVLRQMYDLNNDGRLPGYALVAMERLSDVQLHPKGNAQSRPIDTAYALKERNVAKYLASLPDVQTLGYLRELLDAIVHVNASGIIWGDLKQENMGIDADGHLRIYDFGERITESMDDARRYVDILAYGKLLYNVLAREYAFAPGRHSRSHRGELTTAELVSTLDLLSGAPDGVLSALRSCFSLDATSTPNAIASSVSLLYANVVGKHPMSQGA